MPELPEVETVRRALAQVITGRIITHILIRTPRLRCQVPPELNAIFQGQRITEIGRRAKYLLIRTETHTLLAHLGMSGTFRTETRQEAEETPRKHDHVLLFLSGGDCLIFNDPRRFGLMDVLLTSDEAHHPLLRHLGVEPIDPKATQSALPDLHVRLSSRKVAIKTALLDQTLFAGVGNIYAQEALFAAALSPLTPASALTITQLRKLMTALEEVLSRAITAGGSSISDFTHVNGRSGYFQNEFTVYGREGLPCTRCSRSLTKQVITGRSTVWCVHCQT